MVTGNNPAVDQIERAHLRDEQFRSPPVHRYPPSPALADRVRRYWVPVWDLTEGTVSRQRVLQYPICLIVVTPAYARLAGPTRAMTVTELSGRGWACGVMLQPSAGWHLGGPVHRLVDTWRDLDQASIIDGAALTVQLREIMTGTADDPDSPEYPDRLADPDRFIDPDRPDDPGRHRAAIEALESQLARLPSMTDEDRLVDAAVGWIEDTRDVLRVTQVCDRFAISERALQRLFRRRVGLSPKWVIQRRRLHEFVHGLGVAGVAGATDLADLAADLGYADQAHLTRDFRRVTGMTPAQFRRQRGG